MAASTMGCAIVGRSSVGRRGAWSAVCGALMLAAACSSSPSDGTSGSSEADDAPVEGRAVVDAGSPTDDVAEGPLASGGSDPAGDLATAEVCDLIDPIVDDVVAAADLDIPLVDDTPYGIGRSECRFRFRGDAATVEIAVTRQPALYGNDVAALAAGFPEMTVSEVPIPTLGADALLLESSASGEAYAVFAVGDRVWVATVSEQLVGTNGQRGADLGATAVAVGAAVLDGLGVR